MKMLFGYVQCAVHNRSEHRNVREAGDYLDLLLRRGASLSPVTLPPYELSWPEVYGNLLLWILHSHQTMISTLQFVIYMLAHNPEYQTMAFDEMKFTLGKDNLTYNDLQELAVLDSVILETLRLFSPVQEIWRRSSSETRIFGIAFPKDVDILIPVDLVHSSDSNFSHPDDFKPERWGLGTFGQLPHPAFLPFGYGPRACIASDLVLLQLKVALVHCMRLVEFDVARQDPLPPNQHLEVKLGVGVTTEGILRPATSVKVRLILRGPGLPPPPPTQQIPMSVLPPFGAATLQPSPAPPQPSPVSVAPKVIQTPQETPPSFKPPISAQLIETDQGVQPVKTRYLTSTLPASLDPDTRRERKWKEDKQLTSRWRKDAIVSEVDTKEVGKQMLPSLASRALMVKQATLATLLL
ncbi:cytochrome P450 3A19-like [Pomacea canaliculata]|uniref:cytochrome P450 3A19-like n=1 Tax=Pomacea canaliculata TaxID=400727 RepID=UPI000D726CF6|nr:cytochrome P450 3A19-like [Pomacea canaliculata]